MIPPERPAPEPDVPRPDLPRPEVHAPGPDHAGDLADLPRVLARLVGSAPGPVVVVVGGVHGNEPAGLRAGRRVAEALAGAGADSASVPGLRGELWVLSGHRAALGQGARHLGRDLNRSFTAAEVARVAAQPSARDDAEDAEQRDLLAAVARAEDRAVALGGGLFLLDLHTTSAGGPPFALMGDTLRNHAAVSGLPVPVILGLEESIDGTLIEWAGERGHVGLTVESGQHRDPAAEDLHVAVIWLLLASLGALAPEARVAAQTSAQLEAHAAALRAATGPVPPVLELVYRHGVRPEDGFRMRPDYRGFQPVRRGEHLADDVRGPVRARADGLILMPLYQAQGSDGFFLVRPVGAARLRLATAARRWGLHRALPHLPGIAPHTALPEALTLAPWAERAGLPLLHLFGYRRRRVHGARAVFTRRRPP